jgi:PAS domain S-box-containing protein
MAHPDDPTAEIERLRRCMNDLVSIVALPAMWPGADSSQIVRTLLGALLSMLGLDFVYAQWRDPAGAGPIEIALVAESWQLASQPQDIGRMLFQQWGDDPQEWAPVMRTPLGGRDISVVPLRLGMHGEIGLIAAASERKGFPEQAEKLVLNVAANQASIGLQEARLLSEQKRLTSDRDRQIVQRTGELAAINEELRKEISERKRAEEERERLRQAQRVVVETASDAVVSADDSGAILFANPATMRVFGYDPKELIGKPLTQLMPELVRKLHDNGFKRYLATGQRHINWQGTELTGLRKNGQEFSVEVSFGEMTTNGHRVFTGFIRDITERKQAEEERERLRQVQADLAHVTRVSTMGELTASLAHEIKQPIGAAATNAEACIRFIDRPEPDLPEAREAALEMIKDARRAADIIDRVRLLFQKGSSQLETVDLNQMIEEMVIITSAQANRHAVRIRTDLGQGFPNVTADRVQLQQALMNLMLNGIEAMQGTGGELRVSSRSTLDGQLLISVSDTGVGLPVEDLDKIFNAFFTTKAQGTGLGLAIARSVIESHGGRIWVTANSGGGATFQFTLPQRGAAHA